MSWGIPNLTISSLQIGQTSAEASAVDPLTCAPTLMLDPISCPKSCRLPEAGGDIDDEPRETVLSEGARGLTDRGADGGVGGARPLPLPKMRPPPSLRPDIFCARARKNRFRLSPNHGGFFRGVSVRERDRGGGGCATCLTVTQNDPEWPGCRPPLENALSSRPFRCDQGGRAKARWSIWGDEGKAF